MSHWGRQLKDFVKKKCKGILTISLAHFSMTKGDLVMADAGYGTARNYIYAQEQQADVILRLMPKSFCL